MRWRGFSFFRTPPYIITDVIHIHDDNISGSWFHLLTIMAYAWMGLGLGFVSLYLMQEVVRARFNRIVEWFFVLGMLGRGYAGHVLRAVPALEQLGRVATAAQVLAPGILWAAAV